MIEAFTPTPHPSAEVLNSMPRVDDCKRHCGVCDMERDDPKHPADNAPYTGCQRPKCTNHKQHMRTGQLDTHFGQDCVGLLCVHNTCASNGKTLTDTPCPLHCAHCGDEVNRVEAMPAHKCQWRLEWHSLDVGPRYKTLVATSICKFDETHASTDSTQLVGVRQAGAARLWKDFNVWTKNGEKGPDPRVCFPIIECGQCFAAIWPDGDYASQKPGKEPYSGTQELVMMETGAGIS